MGQTLSAPITEKHSSAGHNERLAYGASAMQGWRITMEDAHTTLLELEDAKDTAFFAVYDGHGGPNVAKYSGEGLHKKIVADKAFSNGDYKTAIKNGFLEFDRALRFDPEYGGDCSGCTAITTTITDKNVLYVGNAGDSRAVLCSDGTAIALSYDHKPVNRANPAILEYSLTENDEFLVLACDGIWDCMTSQEVITFVRKGIADKTPLDTICELTMDHCLASDSDMSYIGCDNMTMLIVAFLNGRTLEEWYEHVSWRVATRLGPADPKAAGPNGDEDPELLAEGLAVRTQHDSFAPAMLHSEGSMVQLEL
ncbi:Protein phosphatase 2C 2 [Mortierella sp. GBA30]|nr:Protein phosphatase 2C 2 [Mortierella sp. GBA30]